MHYKQTLKTPNSWLGNSILCIN